MNNGIIGYTLQPFELVEVMKLMKWTGCLPALSSMGFSIRNRRVFLFLEEGRPARPLIHLDRGKLRKDLIEDPKSWRDLVLGKYPKTAAHGLSTTSLVDPYAEIPGPIPLAQYKKELEVYVGAIEYVDPYEQNEAFIVNFPEHLTPEASHMEIHPCTIVSIVNGMIPFANFNQSPRNQLSCSQSKQGIAMYATNFQNRYDNAANIMCYGESPIVRTLTYDILGDGQMPYGHNLIMAIMSFQGYNQDDGIVFNEDSFQRGMFRNMNYRSYETFEEVDKLTNSRSTVANPLRVQQWTDLKPGRDYTKLDDRGIIKVGELVNEDTVIVGKYIEDKSGKIKDASLTPQVWTSGRVESVVATVNNSGNLLVKVRITQDRTPELGDKFSTRHGQKGTIGMRFRAHDLPHTADGLVPDMLVNPHCIPSRMTIAQLMEMIFGEVCYKNSMIGDATLFMSDASAPEAIGKVLEGQFGMEKTGNQILYDGASGVQMPTTIFMGPVFAMRLKHMVEDKWNARAEGRKEQKTHQPTGGRGAQGGLRIGEMERDALAGHGIARFLRESLMERADKTEVRLCNGCGTVPIFNERQNLFICSLCDGPVQYIGTTAQNMEILPTTARSLATTSIVEMPYATKLLADELQTYMNMGIRILTGNGVARLNEPDLDELAAEAVQEALGRALPDVVLPETRVPEYRVKPVEDELPSEESLYAMGVIQMPGEAEEVLPEEEEAAAAAAAVAPAFASGSPGAFAVAPATVSFTVPVAAAAPAQGPQQATQAAQTVQATPLTQTPAASSMTLPSGQVIQVQPPPSMQVQSAGQRQSDFNAGVAAAQIQAGGMPYFQQGGVQFTAAAPIVYTNAIPGNQPPTIVIDTSPQAMNEDGYQGALQQAVRGVPVMGGGSAGGRRTTPRARDGSPRRGPSTVGGMMPNANQRITIQKMG